MTTLSRRHLLTATALAPIALGGCSKIEAVLTDISGSLPTWAQQLASIANGVLTALPILSSLPGISSSASAEITSIATDVKTVAGNVGSATVSAGAGLVAQLEGAVNAAVAAAAGLPLGAAQPILAAIAAALPIVEAAVGMVVSYLSSDVQAIAAPVAAAVGAAPAPRLSPTQALAYLASLPPVK